MAWHCSGHTYRIQLYLTWENNVSVQTDKGNVVFKQRFPVIFMYYDFRREVVLMRIGTDVIFAVRVCVYVVFTQSNHTSESKTSHCFRTVLLGGNNSNFTLQRSVYAYGMCIKLRHNCLSARLKNNTSARLIDSYSFCFFFLLLVRSLRWHMMLMRRNLIVHIKLYFLFIWLRPGKY